MSFMSFASEMLGNLFKPPATSQYPFEPRKVYEADRGKVINNIDNCIFCGMCMRNCPSDAITVDRNARTWKINRFACVQCKESVTTCPKKCLTMDTEYPAPATEKEEEVLQGPPPPPKPQVVLTEAQKAAIAAAQAKKAAAQKAAAEAGQAKA